LSEYGPSMTQMLREYVVHIPVTESYASLNENLHLFITDKINIIEFEMFCIT